MAEHLDEAPGLFGKYHFLIRRLHSLSGIVPVGAFLCFHLFANASVLLPAETAGGEFQRSVDGIHVLGSLVVPVEIVFIFIPILFHALLGFAILLTGESNTQHYREWGNVRYTLQRITGVIAFVFILYHLWQMHWLGKPFGGAKFDPHDAAATAAATIQAGWWIAPLYAIGVVASVFHLANGIWTALITWGITIRPRTQRVSGYACTVLGVLLTIVGLSAVSGFRTFDLNRTAAQSPGQHASATHAP